MTGSEGVLVYGAGGLESVVRDAARSLVRTEHVADPYEHPGPCRKAVYRTLWSSGVEESSTALWSGCSRKDNRAIRRRRGTHEQKPWE